jgi:dolichol-phosphate mannosyltransferase
MIAELDSALTGVAWEVIYVDDNSPDGTAQEVRRVGQKGLLHPPDWPALLGLCGDRGRVISSAEYVAVIDGDLQYDETQLPIMLTAPLRGR